VCSEEKKKSLYRFDCKKEKGGKKKGGRGKEGKKKKGGKRKLSGTVGKKKEFIHQKEK